MNDDEYLRGSDGEPTQLLSETTGTTLGRYKLLRKIGLGGMGEVWLAEDPRLHRRVAIKILPVHNQQDREFLQRFEREARAAAALNHPHILPVHDYGDQKLPDGQGMTYIVMPYVTGGTLSERITSFAANKQLMPAAETLNYLSQVAEAIDYAHGQHVLHRDIKPGNILLHNEKWLMLADFGIARILSSDEDHLTQAGVGIGTPEYMAPEQAQGKAEPASDNYSLAVIAYQIFTGQLPFRAETPYATTIQHLTLPPPAPRQINPDLSLEVEHVLLHGLAKNPHQRPSSAQAFVEELRQALSGTLPEGLLATQASSSGPMPTMPAPGLAPTVITEPQFNISTGSSGPSASKLHVVAESKGVVTRRNMLIVGGAAVLAAGGLGTWATTTFLPRTPAANKPTTPTPNPNLPLMTLLGHTQPVSSLVWSPTAPTTLVSAGTDQQTMLWDIEALQRGQEDQGRPKVKQQFSSVGPLLAAWSPDGKEIAIGNSGSAINAQNPNIVDTTADVYQGDLSQRIAGYDTKLMTYFGTTLILALCWWPGKYLVSVSHPHATTGTGAYMLEFRDPLHPEQGLISLHEQNFAYAIENSPDGSRQAIGTGIGVIVGQLDHSGPTIQWKTEAFLPFDKTNYYPIGAVTWSPDSKYVAAINHPQFVGKFMPNSLFSVWDWQSGTQMPFTLPNNTTVFTTAAWCPAPASKLLATGSKDGKVYLWNFNSQTATGAGNALPIRTLTGLNAEITTLAWSFDGRWLAAGYKDTKDSILIWKV